VLRFSLANLLVLVSLAAVTFGAVRMHLRAGILAGLVLWSAAGTALACAHHLYRTAWVIAATASGVLWYLAATAMFGGRMMIKGEPVGEWPSLLQVGYCCAAGLGAAILARLGDRSEDTRFPWLLSVAMAYLAAFSFWVLLRLGGLAGLPHIEIGRWQSHPPGLGELLFCTTLGLIALVPTGLVVIWLLRTVEEKAHDAALEERAVVDAIDALEHLVRLPILEDDVARQARLNLPSTRRYLDRLRSRRIVEWTPDEGFRVPKPAPS
jgi:hypothetical protein